MVGKKTLANILIYSSFAFFQLCSLNRNASDLIPTHKSSEPAKCIVKQPHEAVILLSYYNVHCVYFGK